MSSSLVTSLAKVYDPNPLHGQKPAGRKMSSTGSEKSPPADTALRLVETRMDALSEQMERLLRMQGTVLSRLDGLSQDLGGVGRQLASVRAEVQGSQGTEVEAACKDLIGVVGVTSERMEGQGRRLEVVEKLVEGVHQVISFIGEVVKNSKLVERLFKEPRQKRKKKKKENKDRDGKDKAKLSIKGLKAQKKRKPSETEDAISLSEPVLQEQVEKLNKQNSEHSHGNGEAEARRGESLGEGRGEVVEFILKEPLAPVAQQEDLEQTSEEEVEVVEEEKEEVPDKEEENGGLAFKDSEPVVEEEKVEVEIQAYEKVEAEVETHEKERATQTHEKERAIQTHELERAIQTHAKESTIQTHEIERAIQTDEEERAIQTHEIERAIQTDEKERAIQIHEKERATQTHEQGRAIQTDEIERAIQTLEKVVGVIETEEAVPEQVEDEEEKTGEGEKQELPRPQQVLSVVPVIPSEICESSPLPQESPEVVGEVASSSKRRVTEEDLVKDDLKKSRVEEREEDKEQVLEAAEPQAAQSEEVKPEEKQEEAEEQSTVKEYVIDSSPPPEAPFDHRIVTPKPHQIATFYTINREEVLGGGRFGQVHKCVENSSGLTLAAKIIKARSQKEKEVVKNEIQVMNQLNHANLIQLYAAFESRHDIILVMEYVDGGELFDRIIDENYNLTELDTVLFIRQICEGLQYMHKMYILHLDLKPENILCVSRVTNKIKIIDFGLARRYKPREKLRVNFGTPEFLAPEVINYEFVSFPTDMWSLGVITYMLLSGLSPFLGDDDNETLNNILACQWNFEEEEFVDISEEAKDFITRLLVKSKSWRMSAAESLRHPWLSDRSLHYQLHMKKNKCHSTHVPPPET